MKRPIRINTNTGAIVSIGEDRSADDPPDIVAVIAETEGVDMDRWQANAARDGIEKKPAADIAAIDLALLQAEKKDQLNAEVKRRVKVGVLEDPDKALSVGLGIYDPAIPGLSAQAKDWTAAHIAASNVVQLRIFDSAATLASVQAIDPVNDPVWPDPANYPLIFV